MLLQSKIQIKTLHTGEGKVGEASSPWGDALRFPGAERGYLASHKFLNLAKKEDI